MEPTKGRGAAPHSSRHLVSQSGINTRGLKHIVSKNETFEFIQHGLKEATYRETIQIKRTNFNQKL